MIDDRSPDYSDLPGRRAKNRLYSGNDQRAIDVSVLTPYYNTESFFVETAVSLQNQSLQNWEWVIVNDGSNDADSLDRLKKVVESDSRIAVVNQQNAGPAAARNTAFHHSRGRYLLCLDSDDMIEPTYLEKCIWFLESNPEFAFCNAWSVVFGDQELLCNYGFEKGEGHLQANVGPPIAVIRRQAFEDCGGFDESIRYGHEDWDFWLAMAKAGHWGYTLREFLQWYRKRKSGRFEQITRSGDANARFEDYIQSKYRGLAGRFPAPQRRDPQPFDAIGTGTPITNFLAGKTTQRRVMFIVPWMVIGGADRINLQLIDGLTDSGHDVTVCATLRTDHTWKHRFSALTPDVFVLPDFLRPTDYPRFLLYLIESRGIDIVVIAGSTVGYELLPYLRATSPKVAFVDLCHVEEPHWQNGGHPRFAVGYQDALDLNIVTTRHLAEWMEQRGADRSRIRVLYTGVKERDATSLTTERRSVRAELGIPDDLPIILFGGRICEQKRPALLAEILAALQDADLPFHALIIGDGEQRLLLNELILKHRLRSKVRMLGPVSHERWLSLLAAADVFLLPSAYEGISVALLEAMAAGVVPVVSRVGGQEELIEDGAGFLIPQGINEVADYLTTLRQLLNETEQRKHLSQKSRDVIARSFSEGVTIASFIAMLDESHRLAVVAARPTMSLALAKEFATFGMEFNRLSSAANRLGALAHDGERAVPEPAPPDVRALLEVIAAKDEASQEQAFEIHRLLDVVTAKENALLEQANEIHRLLDVVTAKENALLEQANEIHRLNDVVAEQSLALSGKTEEILNVTEHRNALESQLLAVQQSNWYRLGVALRSKKKNVRDVARVVYYAAACLTPQSLKSAVHRLAQRLKRFHSTATR